jgi:branched-chain amino acid transport system ATP-binding protein
VVLDVIRQLRQDGEIAILAVLPELPLALEIADHVFVMGRGRVVYDGTCDDCAQRHDIHEEYIGIGTGGDRRVDG